MGAHSVIHVTARFRAIEGHVDALLPLLRELAEHSRSEPGCHSYDYYREHLREGAGNGTGFTSFEAWESQEAERAHNSSDSLDALLKQILPLLDGKPEVTRWQRVD